LYTGFAAFGDASVTGSMVKAAVPSVSAKSILGELMTAEELARYNKFWEGIQKGPVEGGTVTDLVAGSNDALKGAGDVGEISSPVSSSADTLTNSANESINLTRTQQVQINTLENIVKDHLKPHDWTAVEQELQGNPIVRKSGVGYYDHVQEMQNSLIGLEDIKTSLEGTLKNPNLDLATRQYLENALNETNYYIQRINDLGIR
jgi:hypothetical protein